MHRFAPIGTLLLLAGAVAAQHPHNQPAPPAPQEKQLGHHACLELERAALERGEGFGMALAADRNAFPGPRHVLELKAQLKLTPEQQAAMEKLFARMQEQALARGREVQLAESRLEGMFQQNRPEAELREETYRIATLRAELRWVHLAAHLAARKLLTPEQIDAYQRLRHASGPHREPNP